MKYPSSLENLIEQLKTLPGVGEKTATRYAFKLLENDEENINKLIDSLRRLKDEIKACDICGCLMDKGICPICQDDLRNHEQIMVVSYIQDVIAIENTGIYNGLYHVLGGVISSSKGIYPEDLRLEELVKRLINIKEIIIATSPTMDGEITALYIDKLLKDKEIDITRLAHGLPMGSSLDYADELTLIKAFDNRRKLES